MESDPSSVSQGSKTGNGPKYQKPDTKSGRWTVDPAKLQAHPTNDATYGDRSELGESFLASIEEHGILNSLVITPDGTIISGHRRWEAAKQLDIEEVPVEVNEYESDLDRRERVIEYNRQRNKTFSQMMRESDVLEEIERKRAKKRQGERTDLRENSPEGTTPEYGRRREKIADKIGIGSGKTYDHAQTVWEAARDGDPVAEHEVDKLDRDSQSIHGAWKKVAKRHDEKRSGDEESTEQSSSEHARAEHESDEEESGQDGTERNEDETLDSDEVILSAHQARNSDVFPKVLDLHVDRGATIADVTYGQGTFWEQVPADAYDSRATDIDPAKSPASDDGVDCRDLPYEDGELDCVVLDPPYAGGFYDADRTGSDINQRMKERYGHAPDGDLTYHDAVLQIYSEAGSEARRVLRDGGTLIAKMQDEVSCGQQHLTHIELTNRYEDLGFVAKDLFVVIRPSRPATPGIKQQYHARKNHSYFMVYFNES